MSQNSKKIRVDEIRALLAKYNTHLKIKNIHGKKKKELVHLVENKLKYDFVKTNSGWDLRPRKSSRMISKVKLSIPFIKYK